jgi:hypothetical protein
MTHIVIDKIASEEATTLVSEEATTLVSEEATTLVSEEATTLVSEEATTVLLKERTRILKKVILIFRKVKSVYNDSIFVFLKISVFSKLMKYWSIVGSNIIVSVSV